jgi:glycosyltransferase involved in cell wall biosynthesis
MNELHLYQALIPAIPEEVTRPLWSVMIPTYNCAKYLRETLTSVLAQDPGSDLMQIEVVDDHSTEDDPKAVVEELGKGRVAFYQQPENVGYIHNFETCLLRSRGHLIHILHGDDYVREGFYQKMQQAFLEATDIGYAFCRHLYMDEKGHWQSISPLEQATSGVIDGWLEKISSGQRIATPSVVVRREVYEQLGGFDRRFTCAGEDWEMWVRIATRYPVWFEVEPLAAYRVRRTGSLTESSLSTGRLAKDMHKATEIIESYLPIYLPEPIVKRVTTQARSTYATWAIAAAKQMPITENIGPFLAQIKEALKCSKDWKTVRLLIPLLLKKGIRFSWQNLHR